MEQEDLETPKTCNFLQDPLSLSDLIGSGTRFQINTNFDEGFTYDIFDELNIGSDDEEVDRSTLVSPRTKSFEELKQQMTPINEFIFKKITKVGNKDLGIVSSNSRVCIRCKGYWEREGAPFDSSFLRGPSFNFYTGRNEVLEGVEVAVRTMFKGEHVQFVIWYKLLFHEMGCPPRVKPKADGLFRIELVSFNDVDADKQVPEEDRNKFSGVYDIVKEIHLKGLDFFTQGHRNACRAFEKAVDVLSYCSLANDEEEREQRSFLIKLYTNLAVCYIKINTTPKKTCIMCKEIQRLTDNKSSCKALFQEGRALLILRLRGRPRTIDYQKVTEFLFKHERDVFYEDCEGFLKIKSKSDGIWKKLFEALNDSSLLPHKLYNFVVNDVASFRSTVEKKYGANKDKNVSIENTSYNESDKSLNEKLNKSGSKDVISISIPHAVFIKVIEKKIIDLKNYKSENITREVYSLKKYCWTPLIRKHLKEQMPALTCCINFNRHWLNQNFSGSIAGKCACGVEASGYIHNFMSDPVLINITLEYKYNGKKCGKENLMGEERMEIGKHMVETNRSSSIILSEESNKVQKGLKHPSSLHQPAVYAKAKHDYKKSIRKYNCPLKSLQALCVEDFKEEIIFLSFHPFIVMYQVPHQCRSYRKYFTKGTSYVSADATGGPFKKILKGNSLLTGVIFLYEVVVNDHGKQYSVFQMLSEVHNANTIAFWLSKWIDSGAPQPKKFVCDGSRAFLIAAICAFTNFRGITDYVNSLFNGIRPECHIAIDFAHFIRKFAVFLAKTSRGVKRFLLCCIGKLIICCNKDTAAFYLKKILYLLLSEKAGTLPTGQNTKCEEAINFFQHHFTSMQEDISNIIENEVISNDLATNTEYENISEETLFTENEISNNKWCEWAYQVEQDAKQAILLEENKTGDKNNPYEMPKLAKYLLQNISLICLWGCICHEEFGYEGLQSSSASVESDFNHIKNRVFKNMPKPMRVDEFVSSHINYLSGKLYSIDDFDNETEEDIIKCSEENRLNNSSEENIVGNCSEEKTFDNDVINVTNIANFSEKNTSCALANIDKCLVCAEQNYPTGAHKCVKCTKAVHIFEPCSFPVAGEEEGYGQKRLCYDCYNGQNFDSCFECLHNLPDDSHCCIVCKIFVHPFEPCSYIVLGEDDESESSRVCSSCKSKFPKTAERIASGNTIENWRGLVKKKTRKERNKKSIYLKKHPATFFVNQSKKEIRILRNGNDNSLQLINIEGKDISLANTCAHDSIFQILYVAYLDHADIRISIDSNENSVGLFSIIKSLGLYKRITTETYKKRCQLLMEFFPLKYMAINENYILNCETTVAKMIQNLFRNKPCFQELYTCKSGCKNEPHNTYSIGVDRSQIKNGLERKIESTLNIHPNKICCYCQLDLEMSLNFGEFLFLETYDTLVHGDITNIKVNDIPDQIKITIQEKITKYRFLGAIEIKNGLSKCMSASNLQSSLAHYLCIIKRCDGTFVKCDNNAKGNEAKSIRSSTKFIPELLIYYNTPNA